MGQTTSEHVWDVIMGHSFSIILNWKNRKYYTAGFTNRKYQVQQFLEMFIDQSLQIFFFNYPFIWTQNWTAPYRSPWKMRHHLDLLQPSKLEFLSTSSRQQHSSLEFLDHELPWQDVSTSQEYSTASFFFIV